jgi:hypothetical protein
MAKRSPSRGARAWQVESVWVKRREGPERVLGAYRLLLDLPPRRALRELDPPGCVLEQEKRPAAAEGTAEAASLTAPDALSL